MIIFGEKHEKLYVCPEEGEGDGRTDVTLGHRARQQVDPPDKTPQTHIRRQMLWQL